MDVWSSLSLSLSLFAPEMASKLLSLACSMVVEEVEADDDEDDEDEDEDIVVVGTTIYPS